MARILTASLLLLLAAPVGLAKAFFVQSRASQGGSDAGTSGDAGADGGASGTLIPVRYVPPTVTFRVGCAPSTTGLECAEFAQNTGGIDAKYLTFDEVATAVKAAFKTWNDKDATCSSLRFTPEVDAKFKDTDPNTQHFMRYYSSILVFFQAGDAVWGPKEAGRQYPVGKVEFSYDDVELRLNGGTIVLNSRDYPWSTAAGGEEGKLDVQSVVTALIGRSMGIGSTKEGNTTLPKYGLNNVSKRELGQDDLDALRYLYPTGAGSCPALVQPEKLCTKEESQARTCPPPVTTTGTSDGLLLGDTSTGGGSGGGDTPADAGVDGGTEPAKKDGCSCTAAGASSDHGAGALAVALSLIGLTFVRRRRRAQR